MKSLIKKFLPLVAITVLTASCAGHNSASKKIPISDSGVLVNATQEMKIKLPRSLLTKDYNIREYVDSHKKNIRVIEISNLDYYMQPGTNHFRILFSDMKPYNVEDEVIFNGLMNDNLNIKQIGNITTFFASSKVYSGAHIIVNKNFKINGHHAKLLTAVYETKEEKFYANFFSALYLTTPNSHAIFEVSSLINIHDKHKINELNNILVDLAKSYQYRRIKH